MASNLEQKSKQSVLAFGRIKADSEGRPELESAVNYWLQQIDRGKRGRSLQHFENAAMLLGNHLTHFYYDGGTFSGGGLGVHQFGITDTSPYDSVLAKTSDNRLIRPTETMVSMLVQTRPSGRVTPNSTMIEDEDAADLAQIVLDLVWERPLNMAARLHDGGMIGAICGTVAFEIEYGETDLPVVIPGRIVMKPSDELDEDGDPIDIPVRENDRIEYRKDIMCRTWTPFHISVDPTATNPENMNWVARTSFQDIDWIKENFNRPQDSRFFTENLGSINEQMASDHTLYWWCRVQDILESPHNYIGTGGGATSSGYFGSHGGYAPNQTRFTVVDVKPTKEHPRGRTLILAGGKLIYAGDARAWSEEYPWRWHPYAFWSWFRIPGRFEGVPLLTELVPLQRRINAIDTLVHINRQFLALGQWLIPKHARVPDGTITGIPAQNINYTDIPGLHQPERVKHIPLPGELIEERAILVQAIDLIAASGILDTMQISRSAARAGVLLNFLRQEKLRSKSPMLQEFERCVETICQNILIELQLNLNQDDPELTRRIQAAARDHSSLQVESFTGASLRDHHRIKLDIASELLKAPEAKKAAAGEIAQYFNQSLSPEERRGIFKVMELDEFLVNQENRTVDRVRRMVHRIVQAGADQNPETRPEDFSFVHPADNAKAALDVISNATLDDKFNDYPKNVKQILFDLRQKYSQMIEQEFMRNLQRQMMVQQAMGGGGASAQPARSAQGRPGSSS